VGVTSLTRSPVEPDLRPSRRLSRYSSPVRVGSRSCWWSSRRLLWVSRQPSPCLLRLLPVPRRNRESDCELSMLPAPAEGSAGRQFSLYRRET